MTAKQKKLFLLTSMMSVFVMAVAVLFTGGKFNFSPLNVRGTTQVVEGSITWDWSSTTRTSHAYNEYSYLKQTQRGTGIYLYTFGAGSPNSSRIWTSKYDSSKSYGVFISSAARSRSLFTFQSITSVTFVTTSMTDAGAQFNIYQGDTDTTPIETKTVSSAGQTITFTPESTVTCLAVNSVNDNKWVEFSSITVNYSCSPSGVLPVRTLSSISVSGQNTEFAIGDEFEFGGTVTAIYDDESEEDVTSYATFVGYNMTTLGEQTVTVSYNNVSTTYDIEIVSGVLDSISLSGQTTSYVINDTFSFDGIVTATYENGYEQEVTATSITSPNMSTGGEKTVTVAYTEGGITRTASYTIEVSNSQEVTLQGTYTYASREHDIDTYHKDWSLHNMTLTFSGNKCTWKNVWTKNAMTSYDCEVYYTYVAIDDGSKINITMTVCDGTQDDKILYNEIVGGNPNKGNSASWFSGSAYDRPANGALLTNGNGTKGTGSRDLSTIHIETYQYVNSTYSYCDTLTFNLAS